jgi:hypothetical protein
MLWLICSCCSASALLLLLLSAVYYFAEKFMVWSAFQALVMLVQNRYQKRRMYTRIAMGKNSAMDVVSGESSGSVGQLMVLYPLLFSESHGGQQPLVWLGRPRSRVCSSLKGGRGQRCAASRIGDSAAVSWSVVV